MPDVLACIDRSAYSNSVCDHAAWFAGRLGATIRAIHVNEGQASVAPADGSPRAEARLQHALDRLHGEGALEATAEEARGQFIDYVSGQATNLIVMGKRGELSHGQRTTLGASVEKVIRATATPVCLTSKIFLPITRALVLLDADMDHRRSVEFLASHPGLADLDMDLVVVQGPDQDASEKLSWARASLLSKEAEAFVLEATDLDDATARYIERAAVDLVIVSRAVLLSDVQTQLQRIEARGVWGIRTPVLVC
ncbi:universal stress protein [Phenylobacterium sp.]|uniref:universal stress protein n=1 Tax=Phenylobacterium sp. TaxID=1871053 RepID=UPI0030F4B07B